MCDIEILDQSLAEKALFFTKKELNCLYYTENEGDTRPKLFNRKERLFRSPEMIGLPPIQEASGRNLTSHLNVMPIFARTVSDDINALNF